MRVGCQKTKRSMLPFQIGILQSITALKKLYTYLIEQYNIKYILTCKLTQDCLENFFSQIRSLGRGYNHPNPLEFIYRYRNLLFTKNFTNIQFNKNIQSEKINEPFVSFNVAKLNQVYYRSFSNSSAKIGDIELSALDFLARYVAFNCKKYPL